MFNGKYRKLKQKYEEAIADNLFLGRNLEGWMERYKELEKEYKILMREKASKQKLNDMKVLECLIKKDCSGYHEGSMVYVVHHAGRKCFCRIVESTDMLDNTVFKLVDRQGKLYPLNDFRGWLDIEDLPSET